MLFNEPLLEPVARYWRFSKGIKEIKKNSPLVLVDLGCGPKKRFYYFAKKRKVIFKKYVGIDQLINHTIKDSISLPDNYADYVVAFAFIEHLNNPKKIVKEAIRVVKKGGKIIITAPSYLSEFPLEILARINFISKKEVKEHKNYFNKDSLFKLLPKKKINIYHRYFELGLNNFLVIEKEEE